MTIKGNIAEYSPKQQLLKYLITRYYFRIANSPFSPTRKEINNLRAELMEMSDSELLGIYIEKKEEEIQNPGKNRFSTDVPQYFCDDFFTADYKHWSRVTPWTIDQATALVLGKAPELLSIEAMRFHASNAPLAFNYQRKYDLALQAIKQGLLDKKVTPRLFIAWAKKTGLDIPPQLIKEVNKSDFVIADLKKTHQELNEEDEQVSSSGTKTPWGNHTTKKLHLMYLAYERFWTNYDPDDPSTASTNEQVADWLVQQGMSKRASEIIATILRADGLRTGPRI